MEKIIKNILHSESISDTSVRCQALAVYSAISAEEIPYTYYPTTNLTLKKVGILTLV